MKINLAGWKTVELIYASMLGVLIAIPLLELIKRLGTIWYWITLIVLIIVLFIHFKGKPNE